MCGFGSLLVEAAFSVMEGRRSIFDVWLMELRGWFEGGSCRADDARTRKILKRGYLHPLRDVSGGDNEGRCSTATSS